MEGFQAAAPAVDSCSLPAYLRGVEVSHKVMAEYIWLGLNGALRSRTRVLDVRPHTPDDAPVMVVLDGEPLSPECEPSGVVQELFLKPRKVFRDPFRGGDHVLVLCDTFRAAQAPPAPAPTCAPVCCIAPAAPTTVLQPSEGNTRVACENVAKVAERSQPLFAGEQQYAVIHPAYPTVVPLGPPKRRRSSSHSNPGGRGSRSSARPSTVPGARPPATFSTSMVGRPSGGAASAGGGVSACGFNDQAQRGRKVPTFLSVPDIPEVPAAPPAAAKSVGRALSEAHLRCCLYAGVNVTGAEAPAEAGGVQSFKVGPCQGVDFGDQIWTSRYLLQRVAEDHGAAVSWDPQAAPGSQPLGLHVKYSTTETRIPGQGLMSVQQQLSRLQEGHVAHVAAYYSGRLDAAAAAGGTMFKHSVGVVAEGAVSIPLMTMMRQGGYYVDRRPPADADPYVAAMMLVSTTLQVPLPALVAAKSQQQAAAAAAAAASTACCGGSPYNPASHMSSYALRTITGVRRTDCCLHEPAGRPVAAGAFYDDDEDQDVDDEDGCSDADSMDTEGSYDLLLDELARFDKGDKAGRPDFDGDMDEDANSECESKGECSSDGTSPDRSWLHCSSELPHCAAVAVPVGSLPSGVFAQACCGSVPNVMSESHMACFSMCR